MNVTDPCEDVNPSLDASAWTCGSCAEDFDPRTPHRCPECDHYAPGTEITCGACGRVTAALPHLEACV